MKTNNLLTSFMHINRAVLLLVIILALMVSYVNVYAAGIVYYVDKTNKSCSDTGPGTSSSQPFCTISKGASVALAGDTVQVLAGTYAETVSVPKSGSAGLPITFSANPGVTVSGNGSSSGGSAFSISKKSYVVVDGFAITNTADYGINVSYSSYITISDNHISYAGRPSSGSTRMGIFLNATTNSLVTRNILEHNTDDGIRLASGAVGNTVSDNSSYANATQYQRSATGIHVNGSGSYNNTLLHNITYANEDTGIQFYNKAHNNYVIGNLTYGNGDHGIDISNAPANIIIGNTVEGNHTAGINLEGYSGTSASSGATLMNNVTMDNGIAPITGQKSNIRVDASSIAGTTIDYDLVYLSGAGTVQIQWNGVGYTSLAAFRAAVPNQEVHGLQANPLFISPVPYAGRPPKEIIGDFHVNAGSPVIDSANSNAPNEPITDLDGKPRVDDPATINTGAGVRSYDDRGVYEYQPAFKAPSATPTGTPTATSTPTQPALPPSATPTSPVLPSETPTVAVLPSDTPVPPSPTATAMVLPSDTPLPPTVTATPTVASNGTLTFGPIADTYSREAGPNSNYGTNVQLWVASGSGANYISYLKFTASGVGGPVKSATLRVYSTSSTVDGPAVYSTDPNWSETTLTWNNQPALTSAGLDKKGAIASGIWVEYNVTPLVTGNGTYSFALVTASTDGVSFSSHEGSQPAQLVINYGP